MSSSNALSTYDAIAVGERPDRAMAIERPLVGAMFRYGAPALELAIANGARVTDFLDSGCGELFELLRQARLDGRPLMLAALMADIEAQGLADAASAALQTSASVDISDVPFLARALAYEGTYAEGMQATGRFHLGWTTTYNGDGKPADLLRVLEACKWSLKEVERRLKSLL